MAEHIESCEFFAFPFSYRVPSEDGKSWVIRACHGMNLRDWLAAMAMSNVYTQHEMNPYKVAKYSYEVADAMIAIRGTVAPRDVKGEQG